MSPIRIAVKLALLMVSYAGFWELARERCKINLYFVPLYTISVQFTVLFAAGILNYLREATFVMYGVGLLLALYYLWKKKWDLIAGYFKGEGGFIFLFLALAVIALSVYQKRFSEIDNFTHWGLVAKTMLNTGRFPCMADTAIEFRSYPLGSSALIYYFCALTWDAECFMMLAQAFVMLCTVLPLFSYVKKNRILGTIWIAILTGFLFTYNIPITELQVDSLLPLAGMAGITFVRTLCTDLKLKGRQLLYYVFPVLFWVQNIKNAGLFFVFFAWLLLVIRTSKRSDLRKEAVAVGLMLLAGLSVWNHHCSYVYPEMGASQHSLSLEWFRLVVANKGASDLWNQVINFGKHLVTRKATYWILAWAVLLTALVWGFAKEYKKNCGSFLLSAFALYGLYAVCILGMYLFSMYDATGLPSAERYLKVGDTAVYYMIGMFVLPLLSDMDRRRLCAAAYVGMSLLTVLGWRYQTGEYTSERLMSCTMEWRDRIEFPIREYGVVKKSSYLLCVREEDNVYDSHFPEHIWRYNMESGAVDQVVVTNAAQLEKETEYDYLIILDEQNPAIQSYLEEHYPEAAGSQVIQHFQ